MEDARRSTRLLAGLLLITGLAAALVTWGATRAEPSDALVTTERPRQATATRLHDGTTAGTETAAPKPADARRAVAAEPTPEPATEDPTPETLVGRVLLASGAPAAGASVRLGSRATVAGEDGAFTLEVSLRDHALHQRLVAVLAGHQPALFEGALRAPQPLTIMLSGAALSIEGQLLDDRGAACAGWHVQLKAGTDAGVEAFPPLCAEDLAAGGTFTPAPPHLRSSIPLARVNNPNLQSTGEDGAFALRGLRAGVAYVVRAWNEQTLQTVESPPIPAGTLDAVVRVPTDVFRARVDGVVVSRFGAPIEGVRVRLTMRVHRAAGSTSYQTSQEMHTDQLGRFWFEHVPREDLLLRCNAPQVESLYYELAGDAPGEGLRIQLACVCPFRFEALPGAPVPDALRVVDAEQNTLRILEQVAPGSSRGGERVTLRDGRSPELTVSDAAAWIELEADGQPLRRVPLRLLPGPVQLVRG